MVLKVLKEVGANDAKMVHGAYIYLARKKMYAHLYECVCVCVTYYNDCGCESTGVVRCHVCLTFVLVIKYNDGPHVVRCGLTLRHNLTNTVCSLF